MIALALIFDSIFGEPQWLWRRVTHPVVLMGRLIDRLEGALNAGPQRRAKGALAVAVIVAVAGLVGAVLAALGFVFEVLAAAILLAHRSLVEHVGDVARGLAKGLDEGRAQVARIVGRDPKTLDRAGVARAAVESAAENFSDGVVAPVFWLALGGLPGMVIYKAVNTADSMIGHRSPRFERFGWAAARLDDVMNFIPARLTAGLFAMVGAGGRALQVARRDARLHRSVNAGWPEAAMATALGLRLAGPRVYEGRLTDDPWLHPEGRGEAQVEDVRAALRILGRAWEVLLALALVAMLF